MSEDKMKMVREALEPDNIDFPEGLSLHVENTKDSLIFDFESRKNTNQLVSTIDEVIEHIQLALKVIR